MTVSSIKGHAMLKADFSFAFDEFHDIETQIQFFAPFESVSLAFNNGYIKWEVNGLGEAFGFWFKLKSSKKAFIVKTMTNTQDLAKDELVEWFIDAEGLEVARQVFLGLDLGNVKIAWQKGL